MQTIVVASALLVAAQAGSPGFMAADKNNPRALSSSCSLYGCTSCGSCFNPGSRPGVMCNGAGSQIGYYCPGDRNGAEVGDVTYACMDWTFGSSAMRAAEASFNVANAEDVFLGVGTYGTSEDPQWGIGACYRLRVEGLGKDIIAQSINTGHDVAGSQFDLQIGAGGAGAFNTCAGGAGSMYSGGRDAWGCVYGGVDTREACAKLPTYPIDGGAMEQAGDSLIALCEYGWDQKVRLSGAGLPAGECKYNPTILDVSRVKCPEELVHLTQIQRTDEPESYAAAPQWRPKGFPNLEGEHKCHAQVPGTGVEYCLTRMMDCRKPSGAFKDNVRPELMVPGRKVAQTCTADGYTRIDVSCGCSGCYC
mmetsp:Transcript_13428/g.47337  ORF Transcript_13428/g.47337 Transcript_13428/m.47337 type:complete len:363 (-) Transcript_13428:366-1454(-)